MATDLGAGIVPHAAITLSECDADSDEVMSGPTTRGSAKSGYALWSFNGSIWSMTKDRSAAGYQPSPPPSVPGRFKGQVRAILSVPI